MPLEQNLVGKVGADSALRTRRAFPRPATAAAAHPQTLSLAAEASGLFHNPAELLHPPSLLSCKSHPPPLQQLVQR